MLGMTVCISQVLNCISLSALYLYGIWALLLTCIFKYQKKLKRKNFEQKTKKNKNQTKVSFPYSCFLIYFPVPLCNSDPYLQGRRNAIRLGEPDHQMYFYETKYFKQK